MSDHTILVIQIIKMFLYSSVYSCHLFSVLLFVRSIPLLSFIVPALKDELPRWAGVQYAPGEEQRNSPRRNEEAEPKQEQRLVVDVSGGETEVRCCIKQYCIGTWNVRSMNQGKLEVVNRRWQK